MSRFNTLKTIVHIVDFQPRSNRSMDIFLLKIADEMRTRHWRTVFVFSGAPTPEFAALLRERDVSFMVTRFPLTLPGALGLIRRLRPYRPDVMHTCYISPFDGHLWAVRLACGIRNWVVSDRSSGFPSAKSGLLRRLAVWRGALTGAMVQQIIAISQFVAIRNREHGYMPSEKIEMIYNGVDVDRFAPVAVSRPAGGPLRIVYVGQLIPEKGVMLLLQAMRNIAERHRCELWIAGVGTQEAELREYCRRHDLTMVKFLGHVDDTPQLYSAADVVVVPSQWQEAFGFVVAEAMACGACVLASDAGGIPEVVGADDEAGATFRSGDVDHLTTRLCHLLQSPSLREQMGIQARERIVRQFSDATMVAKYAVVLDRPTAREAQRARRAALAAAKQVHK